MIVKRPTRTIGFIEQDENFVKKLAQDVGCDYCKANEHTYKLNRSDADDSSGIGVFAWVHKEKDNHFWVSTRRVWVEEAKTRAVVAREEAPQVSCFPRDYDRHADSVCLDTKDNYVETVRALKLINQVISLVS